MIGFLSGRMAGLTPEGCFVDVGGVGYLVACSSTTLAALPGEGETVRLWIHTHVREDLIALYGFATDGEQRLFQALLGVAGVGPRVALQVCSAFSPERFRRALMSEDLAGLASVPGIGRKTAQRILIDLKEKLALPDLQVVGGRPDTLAQARSALENLGYSPGEVRAALGEAATSDEASVEDVVKSALKVLA
ncbi:MAG: Holliday junction branch migration protein RuvA [Actinomycetota bacterium]